MKTFTTILIGLTLAFSAFAQTPTPTPTVVDKDVVITENSPSWLTGAEGLAQTIFAAHAASLAIYPSWDPYITVGGVRHPYGWGAALLYPVSEYAFAGVRLDFLGNTFWAPSAVIGAKYTVKSLPLTPTFFTVAGII